MFHREAFMRVFCRRDAGSKTIEVTPAALFEAAMRAAAQLPDELPLTFRNLVDRSFEDEVKR